MSFDALAWAAKCRIPRSADKLVLLGLAENCHRQTKTAFPSIEALIEFSSLNRKTVIIALGRLEEAGLIEDTGDRCGRTRQVKIYRVNIGTDPKTGPFPKSGGRSPKTGPLKGTVFSDKESQKRDTEPVREPIPPAVGDKSPPAPPEGGRQPDLPLAGDEGKPSKRKGSRLPDDWQAPPTEDLPLALQAVVRTWPPGAYEFVAARFIAHWLSTPGAKASKLDWTKAWHNWLPGDASLVMKLKRDGVDFGAAVREANGEVAADDPARALIRAGAEKEGDVERTLRRKLREHIGARGYDLWLKPTVFVAESGTVRIWAASAFMRDWIASNFAQTIAELAASHWCRQVQVEVVQVKV